MGVEVWLYFCFNLGARWGGWLTPRLGRLTSCEESRYASYRRPGGPQGRSGRVWKISPVGVSIQTTCHNTNLFVLSSTYKTPYVTYFSLIVCKFYLVHCHTNMYVIYHIKQCTFSIPLLTNAPFDCVRRSLCWYTIHDRLEIHMNNILLLLNLKASSLVQKL